MALRVASAASAAARAAGGGARAAAAPRQRQQQRCPARRASGLPAALGGDFAPSAPDFGQQHFNQAPPNATPQYDAQYDAHGVPAQPQSTPPPVVVEYSPENANSVKLMGKVTSQGVKYMVNKKPRASFGLGVAQVGGVQFFNVVMWDLAATQVHEHVRAGDLLAIEGTLKNEKWTDKVTGQPRTGVSITATAFGFAADLGPDASMMRAGVSSSGAPVTKKELWNMLFADYNAFWDNRVNKINPNGPDFKHKDSGDGLWLDGKFPVAPDIKQRVLNELPDAPREAPFPSAASAASNPETAELWQRLLDDPSQWWDNRVNKQNPRGPDFKHKVSAQPLWLNSCPPHFVAQVNAIPISGSAPAGGVPAGAAVVGGAGAYQTQNASTGTSQYTDSGMGGAFGAQGGAGNGSATSGEGGYPTAGYPVDGLGYGGGGDAEEEIPF